MEEQQSESVSREQVQSYLERLWTLRRDDPAFDQLEGDLTDVIRNDPSVAHELYHVFGNPSERWPASLLWHLCAAGCSFDVIVRTHFEKEGACRERQSFQGSLPLHVACGAGCDVTTIEFLVKQYPKSREEADEDMNYPLHIALLSHPNRAELVSVLSTPACSADLTVPWDDTGFPLNVLDALLEAGDNSNIALETNPVNPTDRHNIVFFSSRFHGFCPEIRNSFRITVGLNHLETTLRSLAQQRVPLVALNIKFFEALPIPAIGAIHTLKYLFLQKGELSHHDFAALLQALSRLHNFVRLHVRSSRTLSGFAPIQLLGLIRLTHLDLGHNGIGASLASPLAQVLEATKALVWLDIGGNNIGSDMKLIYAALGINKTVKVLEMVGECTGSGLVKMLQEDNMVLKSINIGMSHPLRPSVDFWCTVNWCGRARMCCSTKSELVDLLVEVRRKTSNVVGVYYALLRTNPAAWSH
jgi:hypothetical protein